MSRARYVKLLEKTVESLKKVTNDLTEENYELRQLLKNAAPQAARYKESSLAN